MGEKPQRETAERFLTYAEFSELWPCSIETIRRWVASGDVVVSKRGKLVLIPMSELKRLRRESMRCAGKPLHPHVER